MMSAPPETANIGRTGKVKLVFYLRGFVHYEERGAAKAPDGLICSGQRH